jgi:hypothetical protein
LLPALLGLGNAQAGNGQASVNPPGGFTSACAASLGAGIINNHAAIQAGMGHVHLQADNASPQNIQFPVAVSGGGWSESMVVDVAGHTGQAATWLFEVAVDGSLSAAAGGSAGVMVNAYKNEQELMSNVVGWDNGGSDNFTTDRQRAAWRASRNDNRNVVDEVTFAVPITLGQSFVWGVYATAQAGMASFGGVNDDATSLVSASGIDWQSASPVPGPASWALLLAGTGWLLGLAARTSAARQ